MRIGSSVGYTFTMKTSTFIFLLFATTVVGQVQTFQFPRMGESYIPSSFAHWTLAITTPISTPGLGTFVMTPAHIAPVDIYKIVAFAVVPFAVSDVGASEIGIVRRVDCAPLSCKSTAHFHFAHPGGSYLTSATNELYEAMQAAQPNGGHVVLGPDWRESADVISSAPRTKNVDIGNRRAISHEWYRVTRVNYVSSFSAHSSGLSSIHSTSDTIEQVVFADQFPGADIGDQINHAIAALPGGCGVVQIPNGTYTFGTTIVKPRCILLEGQGAAATLLDWTPAAGAAIVIGDGSGTTTYNHGGVRDLRLSGPGESSQAIGLWLGGDPSGLMLPANYLADNQDLSHLDVRLFGIGIEWGSNAWLDTFFDTSVDNNTVGIAGSLAATNSGENNRWFGGAVFNNGSGAVASSAGVADLSFFGTSFDFNNDSTSGGPDSSLPAIAAPFQCLGCHFEQWSGPFVEANWYLVAGGTALLDSAAAITTPAMFVETGIDSQVALTDVNVLSNHPVTQIVDDRGTGGDASLWISGLRGNGNHQIKAAANSSAFASINSHIDPQLTFVNNSYVGQFRVFGSAAQVDNDAAGRGLVLADHTGSSDAHPTKTLRVSNNDFQITNDAFTSVELDLSDSGALAWGGGPALASSGSIARLSGAKFSGTVDAPLLEQGGIPTAMTGADINIANQVIVTHLVAPLPVAQGGTGVANSTGSGPVVLANSPALSTPTIGGGAIINRLLLASAILAYSPIAAHKCQEQTLTVVGATTAGVASASPSANVGNGNLIWSAWVSADNSVSVRLCNPSTSSIRPNAVSWSVEVVE